MQENVLQHEQWTTVQLTLQCFSCPVGASVSLEIEASCCLSVCSQHEHEATASLSLSLARQVLVHLIPAGSAVPREWKDTD